MTRGSAEVGFGTRLAYGVGEIAVSARDTVFSYFLLIYLTGVRGMPGALAGAAVFTGLVIDAITDPLVGSLSDGFRHRWGRRHLFMLGAALPTGAAFALVFFAPAGMSEFGLFVWATATLVLTRVAGTFFIVPYYALGAELSSNYHERTAVVAYRTFFSVAGGIASLILAFGLFFQATPEYPDGQLNEAAYPPMALSFGAIMSVSIALSALGTLRRARQLSVPAPRPRLGVRRLAAELKTAWGSHSFRIFFIAALISLSAQGVQGALSVHMGTYFWQFTPEQILSALLALSVGILVGAPIWPPLARRLDKKPIFVAGALGSAVFIAAPPMLRLSGLYPAAESPMYLGTVQLFLFAAGLSGAGAIVTVGSMVADMADEQELATGQRQEGLFFALLALGGKIANGAGALLAGIALGFIQLPADAPQTVTDENAAALALTYGPGAFALSIAAVVVVSRYRLDRSRHAEIRRALAERAT